MRFFSKIAEGFLFGVRRCRATRSLIVAGTLLSSAYMTHHKFNIGFKIENHTFPLISACATQVTPQSTVISEGKTFSLFLTIHLNTDYSPKECLSAVARIKIPAGFDESDEVLYGVGFGPSFYAKINPSAKLSFDYVARKGEHGDMPSTGGDIFVHAKCDELGKLFELAQQIMARIPKGAVAKFEDIYGWTYRNGRDLSGFVDGTENPAESEIRHQVAVDPLTGGSYVITQKWVHNHDLIQSTKDSIKEQWVGRTLSDSIELRQKSDTAHVSRMVGSADFGAPAKYQIVRQSQPYGTLSRDSGLLFIAYAADPKRFDWMLDRMTGLDKLDSKSDDIMRMTRCVSGAYWYFPGQEELEKLAAGSSKWRWWG